MKTKRIGLALIALGLVLWLVPFTQGIFIEWQAHNRAAASMRDWHSMSEAQWQARLAEAEQYNAQQPSDASAIVDPFTAPGYTTPTPIENMETDGAFARIRIPAIEVDQPIYLGASDDNLALGAAQVEGTALPVGGVGTRSVLAGHRGFRGIPYFRDLDQLDAGDEIFIDLPNKTLTYLVTDSEVIAPSDNEALAPTEGEDRITLLTCTPYRVNTDRLLVNAVRQEEPEAMEETPESEPNPATEEPDRAPSFPRETASTPTGWHAFSPQRQRTVLLVGGGWLIVLGLIIKIIRFRR